MNREIKFRAWDINYKCFRNDEFLISTTNGGKIQVVGVSVDNEAANINEDVILMQFTGLKDKNGKEIYEGDILKHFILKNYIQQSHPDISPEINEYYVKEQISTVVFKDGAFQCDNAEYDFFIQPLSELGLSDINNIKEHCGCMDDETADCNGNEIDESILGIEIIGNIYETPELIK